MMITVNLVGDYITGSVNGESFGVTFSEQRYAQMKQLEQKAAEADSMDALRAVIAEFETLTMEDYKELIEHAQGGQFLYVSRATGETFLTINGKVSSIPLPKALTTRIIKSIEKKIDVMPLVKCWARFIREVPGRPSYSAERGKLFADYIDADYIDTAHVTKLMEKHGLNKQTAELRATTKQVAISQEGILVCYKVSEEIHTKYALDEKGNKITVDRYQKTIDEDTGVVLEKTPEFVEERVFRPWVMKDSGDAFWCESLDGLYKKEGHIIRVGCNHYLDNWSKVSTPGSKGLHCGGLRYISGFQSSPGAVTHNIFVDPMHIFGIAGLGHGADGAMTTKQYFVHSSFAGVNKGIYHSSKYAELTDKEYQQLLDEAVSAHQQKVKDLEDKLDQQKALLSSGSTGAKLFVES